LPPNTINNGENFKAVRPTRDKVSFVSCRSYEEYVTAELAAQLILIPCLLHVLKPAYTNQESVSLKKGTDK
jgi:hypothetical protein